MESPPVASDPRDELDVRDAAGVVAVFEHAARANLDNANRHGAVIDLPGKAAAARERVLMTGDLHDHTPNLARIVKLARLEQSTSHYLILHEIIHGSARVNGMDLSIRTLARVAHLKVRFPDQVHVLQANHELAQLGGEGILKDGVSVVEAFDAGVDFLYHDQADAVRDAMDQFIRSLPLAMRCDNGIFCSHSLPAPRKIERFDKTVLDRVPTAEDLSVGGDAYLMVWGRHHTQKVADELAHAWGVAGGVFVMGHQAAPMGYREEGDTMLILNSDNGHGMALPFDLHRRYTRDELIEQLVPLAGVRVE